MHFSKRWNNFSLSPGGGGRDKSERRSYVDDRIVSPNGIRFSPDQSPLYVSDYRGQSVYSFNVLPNGSLANRQRFYHLHLMDGSTQSSADGMTVDTLGWLYVTTEMGIQVCDQPGRVEESFQNRHPKPPAASPSVEKISTTSSPPAATKFSNEKPKPTASSHSKPP